MAGSVKGIVVEIGGDTSGLLKSLNTVDSKIGSLSKELKGISTLMKFDPNNTVLLAQKQELLGTKINETKNKLKELNEAKERADKLMETNSTAISAENYRALQREIEKTKRELAELKFENSSLKKFGDSLDLTGTKLQNLGTNLKNVGNKLSIFSGIVAVGVGASIKSAVDFETAFAGVEKTVDATEEELKQMNAQILEMSTQMPATASEIAGVAEAAGQLGIQNENIISFSKSMIELGQATNLTAEDAAMSLAKFANIMQMDQKNFDKLGSSIVDLGNNFATTEADIVEMAMRLAGAGKQVGLTEGEVLGLATALSSVGIEAEMGGSAISKAMVKMQNAVEIGGKKLQEIIKKADMSLHDLELMAANDSKGFKELADTLDMTSTELKTLVNAGKNLEDFSKVSGMTTEQFKKQWKEDAAGALSAFIQGLGNAEDKGESAIGMLTEMGLTEVRLRDSLLRASSAGDLFNRSIQTGTKAWEENIALQNEVAKRNKTTESQLKTLKNEVTKLGIEFGRELIPSLIDLVKNLKPVLSSVSDLLKKFSQLDDNTKQNVIKLIALSATIGPLVKGFGSLVGGIGKVISAGGSAAKSIASLTSGLSGLSNTATAAGSSLSGVFALAVGVLATDAILVKKSLNDIEQAFEDYKNQNYGSLINAVDAAEKETKAFLEQTEASKKVVESQLSQIETSQRLKNELDSIVDSNGKIKAGYEARAKFIVGELSAATGTEIKIVDGVIQKYDILRETIQKTIDEQKISSIMTNLKSQYDDANSQIASLKQNMDEAMIKWYSVSTDNTFSEEYKKKAQKQAQEAEKAYQDALKTIANYEYLSQQVAEKGVDALDEITKRLEYNITNGTNNSVETITKALSDIASKIQTYNAIYEKTGDEAIKNQIKSNEKMLESIADSLVGITSTTENLSGEYITAWKNLGESSEEAYFKALLKVPKDTAAQIQEATGIVSSDYILAAAWANLATESTEEYNNKLNGLDEDTKTQISSIVGILKGDTSVEEAMGKIGSNASEALKRDADMKKSAEDMISQITGTLNSSTTARTIATAASNVASTIKSFLHFSVPDKGPLSDADTYMPDFIKLMAEGLVNSKSRLVKSVANLSAEMKEALMGDFNTDITGLNGEVISSQKTIFTTPQITFNVQELDEAKLKQCFNYVNSKFGSRY